MSAPRTWLVGMNNPYSTDPGYALYPEPRGATGDRLCRVILGMKPQEYLRHFIRRNTLQSRRWDKRLAVHGAGSVFRELPAGVTVVLLGREVWDAWRRVVPERLPMKKWEPFLVCMDEIDDLKFVLLPHPSGLCHIWNDKANFKLARSAIRFASPELELAIPQ